MGIKHPPIRETLIIIMIIFLGCQPPTLNLQSFSLNSSAFLPLESQPIVDYEVLFANKTVIIGNMERETIWDAVSSLQVPEFGLFGSIQLYHDQRYLNGLISFDSDIPWIAVQIVNSSDAECMENRSDGWIFGESVLAEQGVTYTGDAWFEGYKVPHNDNMNDISYEELISEEQLSMVEFRRFRVSNDPYGYDAKFEPGSIHQLLFASTANHLGDRDIRNFLISNRTLPLQAVSSTARTSPHEKNVENFVSSVFFAGIFLSLLLGTIILFDKRKLLE